MKQAACLCGGPGGQSQPWTIPTGWQPVSLWSRASMCVSGKTKYSSYTQNLGGLAGPIRKVGGASLPLDTRGHLEREGMDPGSTSGRFSRGILNHHGPFHPIVYLLNSKSSCLEAFGFDPSTPPGQALDPNSGRDALPVVQNFLSCIAGLLRHSFESHPR